METKNSQRMIREAIRKIALGRSIDRVDMSHCGTGGTARLIHGYVAKINNEEDEYLGTIDVGEFPDETASPEHIIYKGVLLSGLQDKLETPFFSIYPITIKLLTDCISLQSK